MYNIYSNLQNISKLRKNSRDCVNLLEHELVDGEFRQTSRGSMDKVPLYFCSECEKGFKVKALHPSRRRLMSF